VRARVEGRADDVFHYGHTAVDPLVVRTVMVRTPAALEYQVRQTAHGIDIAIVAEGELNPAAVSVALEESLRGAGLPNPQVRVREVTEIARHPETGKARRFIPLTGSKAAAFRLGDIGAEAPVPRFGVNQTAGCSWEEQSRILGGLCIATRCTHCWSRPPAGLFR
jgi:hypothetical protein